MDPKSTVVKSKSSNSAISKKSAEDSRRKYNKTTRSNANFPCRGLKKRGVYVEKRLTKTNLLNGKEVDGIAQKPPPRPRPSQKRFLASVLTILSKSTTGTQYPDLEEPKQRKRRDRNRNNKQINLSDEDGVETKKTKEKFKSRVLNKKFVKEDKKKMVVLQSKKEIAQTPSNYSQWSYKDASQNSNISNLTIYGDSDNAADLNIADELKNALLEGRNVRLKKLRYQDEEPKTLVSDGMKSQKNLYNFFVDLLETTISVYNVKAEYDSIAPEASKTNLQINESIADKLNISKAKKTVEFENGTISPEYLHYVHNETDLERDFVDTKPKPITLEPFKREPVKMKAKKIKDTFLYPNYTRSTPQKSKSVEVSRKTIFRNKNDLINILKQELEVETNTFEEPKSIFQALRVMARNKKKISFDPWLDHKNFTDECVLKRRKIISSRKVNKTNKDAKSTKRPVKRMKTDYIHVAKKFYTDMGKKEDSEIENSESYHSLEVYGFDYEPKFTECQKAKDVSFPYHSSPSNSDFDFNPRDAILTSTSAFSSVRKFSAVVK